MRRLAIVVYSLFALTACNKPKPSTDYADAQAKWDSLTSHKGDDAYTDPEMDTVVSMLDRVPATSSDAAKAAELKGKIASERARVAEDTKRRAADMAVLKAPVPTIPDSPNVAPTPPPVEKPKEDAVADSGQPQVGLAYDEFVKKYGACFSEGEMITVSNMNVKARAFSLVTSDDCTKKHGAFSTKWILFSEGKIIGMVPKDTVKQVTATPPGAADAGAAPAPGGAAKPDAG
jgi:hypothetical protein